MNAIKKYLGIIWMLLSPAIIIFLFWQAADKIGKASEATKANITLQWSIILIIFFPICIGLLIFGYYAVKGYYEHLPESSAEITDY
jgi:ABC-type polysaccharide/polyol phosphate export permease